MKSSNKKWWGMWLCSTLLLAGYYTYAMTQGEEGVFLPGPSSHGHYQIELSCDSCHGEAFDGPEVMQKTCVSCHSAELERVEDSHPRRKFTDPRNADRLERLDARFCVTCHNEHRLEITDNTGVTLPSDFCILCHQDIAEDRASHRDIEFDSCSSSGCHNYHDNKALYEDFLVKHGKGEKTIKQGLLPQRNLASFIRSISDNPESLKPLMTDDANMPAAVTQDEMVLSDWSTSAHARNGVNCNACHMGNHAVDERWETAPAQAVCKQCHTKEQEGFLAGRHGMRSAQNMAPMSPAIARLPMKQRSHEKSLSCHSCHESHSYNTQTAAVEACLSCHNDKHTLAYKKSPHYQLWQQELAGTLPNGSGVSCSSCHLPRETIRDRGRDRIVVQHNQNDYLRPNEKMARPVCMKCHGLEFTLSSLADGALIEKNFTGKPVETIASIEMALKRERTEKKKSN